MAKSSKRKSSGTATDSGRPSKQAHLQPPSSTSDGSEAEEDAGRKESELKLKDENKPILKWLEDVKEQVQADREDLLALIEQKQADVESRNAQFAKDLEELTQGPESSIIGSRNRGNAGGRYQQARAEILLAQAAQLQQIYQDASRAVSGPEGSSDIPARCESDRQHVLAILAAGRRLAERDQKEVERAATKGAAVEPTDETTKEAIAVFGRGQGNNMPREELERKLKLAEKAVRKMAKAIPLDMS